MQKEVVALFILFVVCFWSLFQLVEPYTSPGTLVQLSTSHVPDMNDMYAMRRYAKQVHHDLIDMNGSA